MQQRNAGGGAPIGTVVGIAGGALLVIGSFLTWFTLSQPGTGISGSAAGLDGSDGWITLGAGLVLVAAAILGLIRRRRAFAILAILAGLAGGGVGAYDAATARDQIGADSSIAERIDAGVYSLTVGVGVFLVIGGGALGLIGGGLLMTGSGAKAPEPPVEAGAPPTAAGSPAPERAWSSAGSIPAPPPLPPPPGSSSE